MKRIPALLAVLLSAACSGGTSNDAATPATGATAAAAATTAKASGTATPGAAPAGAANIVRLEIRTREGVPTPDRPWKTDPLVAVVETTPGALVDWQWSVNGQPVAGALGDRLEPGSYKKGDVVSVEATPRSVSNQRGAPRKTQITIRNAPPTITSRPSGSLNGYQVVANDPDGDTLTYTLQNSVPGFSLSATGRLSFDAAAAGKTPAPATPPPTPVPGASPAASPSPLMGAADQAKLDAALKSGAKVITVVVRDSDGAVATQSFDVKL